jgi:hypothetical protein
MVPCLHLVLSMLRVALLVVGSMLTACSPATPSDGPQDAPAGDDDGPPAGANLKLQVALDTELPHQISPDLRLTDVYLSATLVRAIADAGDATLTNCEMHWDSDDEPGTLTFNSPPIGTYSTIDLRFSRRTSGSGSGERAFEIEGRWRGTDFKIEGVDGMVTASPAVQVMLKAGMMQTVKIELALATMLQQIDWDNVDKQDGDYYLDDDDPQMPMVQYGIAIAFRSVAVE